jgi:cation-transporting ATPase 13A1
MRTILFAAEHVTAENGETLLFIGFLLIFAIFAAYRVLKEGLEDERRSRYKLMLHCIMIVTSVVPPELPMELSLAVTNSLVALQKVHIFCTEPFRIPFAGRIDNCCFDKTGTLTSDSLVMQGVAYIKDLDDDDDDDEDDAGAGATTSAGSSKTAKKPPVTAAADLAKDSMYVLAGCHSLVYLDRKLIGDPGEMAAIEAINWNFSQGDTATPPKGLTGANKLQIVHRYAFSSSLKRMSSVVAFQVDGGASKGSMRILTKGAPETLRRLFAKVPDLYDVTHRHFAARGSRVLALGWRDLPSSTNLSTVKKMKRADAEGGLEFAGFLLLTSTLKSDTKKCIKQLLASSHLVTMITGDAALTACDVARQIGITQKPRSSLLLLQQVPSDRDAVHWVPASSVAAGTTDKAIACDVNKTSSVKKLTKDHDLCATGTALMTLAGGEARGGKSISAAGMLRLAAVCPHVRIFARTAPDVKEVVINALRQSGQTTLMCGDGTNDVGALKQAAVGVSIINSPELEAKLSKVNAKNKSGADGADGAGDADAADASPVALRQRAGKGAPRARSGGGPKASANARDRLQQQMEQMDLEENVMVSVAWGDIAMQLPPSQ